MLVGNDVVDLTAPRAIGKAADERFGRRVFTEGEWSAISASRSPDLTLWALWAGKEAAFKVARKMVPAIAFSPRHFEVGFAEPQELHDSSTSPASMRGFALIPGGGPASRLRLTWDIVDSHLHCIATSLQADFAQLHARVATLAALDHAAPASSSLTERELVSVRFPESSAVRRLARMLAAERGGGKVEVVREGLAGGGFGPPRLFGFGAAEPLHGWDLSLSHDGEFIAAVVVHP